MGNRFIKFTFAVLLVCSAFNGFSQNYTVLERDTSFVLSFDNDTKPISADLHLHYRSDTSRYLITIKDTVNDSVAAIELNAPLTYQDLQTKVNEKATEKWSKTTSIATNSLDDIYNWLYRLLNVDERAPASGILKLNREILVIDGNNENEFNDPEAYIYDNYYKRAELIDTANNAISSINARIKIQKKSLLEALNGNFTDKKNADSTKTLRRIKKLLDNDFFHTNNIALESWVNSCSNVMDPMSDEAKSIDTILDKLLRKRDTIQVEMNNHGICKINNVSLQFERGFLEKIKVDVQIGTVSTIFENNYAIGFSSMFNFRELPNIKLFARPSQGSYPYIIVGDVLANYNNIIENYTRDYSPADTCINNISPNVHQIVLRKERLVNLFDSKIYTDLKGTGADAPNGLVQIEVSRRFNLNTIRHEFTGPNSNCGFLNSFVLWGAINKLEDKNKFLMLHNNNNVVNNTLVSPTYATNLDYLSHETSSFGFDFNAFLVDAPNLKFTSYLDFGAQYGYVPLQDLKRTIDSATQQIVPVKAGDTISSGLAGNTITIFPRIRIEFFSEKRVSFQFAYQLNHTWLFSNNESKQIVSYAKSDLNSIPIEPKARDSHMFELFLRVQTSNNPNSMLFLRTRLLMQIGDVNTFFPQFQLGYSYNLVFKK